MDIKDVSKLSELARLELSDDEKKSLLSDMQGILNYVKVIEGIKGEAIEPKHTLQNVWREDTVIPREFSGELITEQFPDSQGGFLKVKKIL